MTKSLGVLDNILFMIFGVSLVVPSILQSRGFNISLAWVPVCFYAMWVIATGYYIPVRTFSDSPERSVIERLRGWSYVLTLPVTFVFNYVAMFVFPRDPVNFLISITVTSLTLMIVVILFPRKLFRKEIVYMEKAHEQQIIVMLRETGSAAILFSIAILLLNSQLSGTSISEIFLTILVSVFLLVLGYVRNRKSSKYAHDITVALINSHWRKKFTRKKK